MISIALQQANRLFIPETLSLKKDVLIGDRFNRASLTPTDSTLVYATGAGTVLVSGGLQLFLQTGATIGDDADIRTSELLFYPFGPLLAKDNWNTLTLDIVFFLAQTTEFEFFIGLVGNAALTALPTTAIHAGILGNVSAGANYTFTSGDGTTQDTSDSGVAMQATTVSRIRITWTGLNTGRIEFFSTALLGDVFPTTLEATYEFTAMVTDDLPLALQFFVSTEAAAAKAFAIRSWTANPK